MAESLTNLKSYSQRDNTEAICKWLNSLFLNASAIMYLYK